MIEAPPRIVPLRYSPKPIDAYTARLPGGILAGPAQAEFLRNDVEAWNLAFLSHPYERRAEHSDPQFTIWVRRTVNTVVTTGSVDILGKLPADKLVRGLLQRPAREFVSAIRTTQAWAGGERVQLLPLLPLYIAYGDEWLQTIAERAGLCLPAPVASEYQPGDDVPHVKDAAALIDKLK